MKNKKLLFVLLAVFVILSLFVVSCKKGSKASEAKEIKVAMATDVGGLGDKSFNDGSYAGLQKAANEFGVSISVVESKEQTDYIPNLTGLAEDGNKVVFAVGFLMADALIEAANKNPNTYFAGVDIFVNPNTAPKNAIGILFKEQESGFLAGVLAGLLTKKYSNISPKLNNKNVVGMVLGMDIPPVERFQAGFYAGVKYVNPDCEVISIVTGSFNDQAKGKEAALTLINKGADIIFQIAGATGIGVINACKEKGVLAIGVDVDQNNLAPDTVITSAVKGITQATYLIVKHYKEGNLVGGQNYIFGIKEDSTGIAPFHDFDSIIPQEVKDFINQVIKDMKEGKIVPPATRAEAGYKM